LGQPKKCPQKTKSNYIFRFFGLQRTCLFYITSYVYICIYIYYVDVDVDVVVVARGVVGVVVVVSC